MIPRPIYLFTFINKSTNKEYPVNDLCTQQKWNTSDNANIKIDGRIEHPTIVSEILIPILTQQISCNITLIKTLLLEYILNTTLLLCGFSLEFS